MDRRLQELRRRFQSSNATEDEILYLQQALRANMLETWQIEIASYLGNKAALALLPNNEDSESVTSSMAGTFVAHGQMNPTDAGDLWASNLGYEYPKDALVVALLLGFYWELENTAIGLNRRLYDFYDELVAAFLLKDPDQITPPLHGPEFGVVTGPEHFVSISGTVLSWIMDPIGEDVISTTRLAFRDQMENIPVTDEYLENRLTYARFVSERLTQYLLGYKTAEETLHRSVLRRNPTKSPIIIIGYNENYSWQMHKVIDDLDELGWTNLLQQMIDKDYEVYDMSTLPEKGDALDHIKEDTPLIIAMHLYGMHFEERYHYYDSGYFYNQGNYKIYLLAQHWNIPLMVIGDQPEDRPSWGKQTLSQQYFTDKAN